MKNKIPLLVFIIVCIINLYGIYYQKESVVYTTKPLLMITLFWYYYANTKVLSPYFLAALAASFLGDVFLLGKGELYFLLGLLFFLIAHIFYVIMVVKLLKETRPFQILQASVPYVIIFIVLLAVLYSGLGAMKIPVIIYAIAISIFGTVSLILYLQNKTKASISLVIGVFIFIISDAVLALNLFYEKQSFYSILIMTTYVLAQYLICRFAMFSIQNSKQLKNEDS